MGQPEMNGNMDPEAMRYFEDFRGAYVDSAIDVIADPHLQDGSISNTLSQDPNRPVHRIYYTAKIKIRSAKKQNAVI